MEVSQKLKDELKHNNRLKALLSVALGSTVYTIDRWFRTDDVKKLTGAVTIHINLIKGETGIKTEDILVDSQPDNPKSIKN